MNKKIIYLISVIVILTASIIIGKSRLNVTIEDTIFQQYDDIKTVKKINENLYYLYTSTSVFGQESSILTIAMAEGYSGPITLGVNYKPDGEILSVRVISQTETPGFYRKVVNEKFTHQYVGRNIKDKFMLHENINAVSGATMSCVGINHAVQNANERTFQLYFQEKFESNKRVLIPELRDYLIILLYLLAVLFSYSKHESSKKFLPLFHLISVILLGFVFKGLLSITHFNNLLLGNFPGNQYYWWLILGLFIMSTLFLGRNLYFGYICPMGIIQDYLHKISPKKIKLKFKKIYQVPAIIGTFAILIYAIIANQPGYFGYEIFSAVFQFDFSSYVIVVAIVSLMISLFIKRFWCRFICPVGLIGRFLIMVRSIFVRK